MMSNQASMFMELYTLPKMARDFSILLACRSLTFFPEAVAPIEREIRDLSNGLQAVKDEQEYIVIRERVHRNTAESTNDRVKWWSIIQAFVLFAIVAWQVYYLKVRLSFLYQYPSLNIYCD